MCGPSTAQPSDVENEASVVQLNGGAFTATAAVPFLGTVTEVGRGQQPLKTTALKAASWPSFHLLVEGSFFDGT